MLIYGNKTFKIKKQNKKRNRKKKNKNKKRRNRGEKQKNLWQIPSQLNNFGMGLIFYVGYI